MLVPMTLVRRNEKNLPILRNRRHGPKEVHRHRRPKYRQKIPGRLRPLRPMLNVRVPLAVLTQPTPPKRNISRVRVSNALQRAIRTLAQSLQVWEKYPPPRNPEKKCLSHYQTLAPKGRRGAGEVEGEGEGEKN